MIQINEEHRNVIKDLNMCSTETNFFKKIEFRFFLKTIFFFVGKGSCNMSPEERHLF